MKIFLGAIILLSAIGVGFIDFGGLVLFVIILAYFALWAYLIENKPAFKEFYFQLAPGLPRHSHRYRWSQICVILAYFGTVFFGFIVPADESFTHLKYALVVGTIGLVYFSVVFLPAIIRTRRALR